jgi:hypothetical protein
MQSLAARRIFVSRLRLQPRLAHRQPFEICSFQTTRSLRYFGTGNGLLPPSQNRDEILKNVASSRSATLLPPHMKDEEAKTYLSIFSEESATSDSSFAEIPVNEAAALASLEAKDLGGEDSLEAEGHGVTHLSRQDLHVWYRKNHNLSIGRDSFVATMSSLKGRGDGGNWWTASFICPLSGDRYDAGTLRNHDNVRCDSDQVRWYRRKDDAISAAASRALDMIQNQESGVKEPRYCEEDPSGAEELSGPKINALSSLEATVVGGDEIADEDVYEIQHVMNTVEISAQDKGEEEEYTIQYIPRRDGVTSHSGARTTLDLIAETWIESTISSEKRLHAMPMRQSPATERHAAIDTALEWIAQQQTEQRRQGGGGERVQFDSHHQQVSVKISNMMLTSLANANHRLPFCAEKKGVEKAAKAILDLMWSSKATKPNSHSYGAYFRCLEGRDPLSIAKRAQRIFDAMKNGSEIEGRILPQPNIGTLNSLIQLWAQVGGKTGRFELDSDTRPNRDTFLAMLSSMTYPATVEDETGSFDTNYARECIDGLRELSEKLDDESLRPDTQIYNSALRWSGGLLSSSTRPYARSMPWDSYDEIFRRGFCDGNDPIIEDARAMENWLEIMENGKSAVRPNIETYESVIQAWTRTGTAEGLLRAEALADRALEKADSTLQPRLHTFHPIISAWIYSGADQGPVKVQEWIDRLDTASDALSDLQLDGRVRAAPIMAHLSCQNRILAQMEGIEGPNSDTLHHGLPEGMQATKNGDEHRKLLESANLSFQCLRGLVDDLKSQRGVFLEADVFSLTIRACSNGALAHCREGNMGQAEVAVSEMLEVVAEFDGVIANLFSAGNSLNEASSQQMLHLMHRAPQVYSSALIGLRDLDHFERGRYNNEADEIDHSHLLRHVQALEKMIRRIEEFRIILNENSTQSELAPHNSEHVTEESIVYDDLFSYPSTALITRPLSKTRTGLLAQILQASDENYRPLRKDAELLRLCMVVTDILRANNGKMEDSTVSVYKGAAQLLKRLETKRSERDGLLGRVARDLDAMERNGEISAGGSMNIIANDIKSSYSSRATLSSDQKVRRRRSRAREQRKSPSPPRNATSSPSNLLRRRKQSL